MDLQRDTIPVDVATHHWVDIMMDEATIGMIAMATFFVHQVVSRSRARGACVCACERACARAHARGTHAFVCVRVRARASNVPVNDTVRVHSRRQATSRILVLARSGARPPTCTLPPPPLPPPVHSRLRGVWSVPQGCYASLRNNTRAVGDGESTAVDAPVRLTWRHAVALPCVASLSLVFLYLFFDRIQFVYIVLITVVVALSLEMTLQPWAAWALGFAGGRAPDSLEVPFCGRVPMTNCLSSALAITAVGAWVLTAHWLLLDVMGTAPAPRLHARRPRPAPGTARAGNSDRQETLIRFGGSGSKVGVGRTSLGGPAAFLERSFLPPSLPPSLPPCPPSAQTLTGGNRCRVQGLGRAASSCQSCRHRACASARGPT